MTNKYEFNINLTYHQAIEAETKKEAIYKLKKSFSDDLGIEIDDDEIESAN